MEALLDAMLRLAAPLLLAALGELLVERSGVVNIGIEGTMLTGAFAGFAVATATGSPLAGVAGAAVAAAFVGGLFAVFAVVRKIDQIVVGMAVNLLALGGTALGSRALYGGFPPTGPTLAPIAVPGLAALPWVGDAFFTQTPFVYGALCLALMVGVFLTRTRPGLQLRAVGESARAADAEGLSVDRIRGLAVVVGAALAGIGGAALSLAQSDTFTEGMTSGRGFIALAIVIFGRWTAGGVTLASLFLGAATALQFRLQARGAGIPYPIFLMLPYVITLVVLAFSSGGSRSPEDLGQPYRREATR